MIEVTTVGPLTYETRDSLRDYKEREEFANYDATITALLEQADGE